MRKINPSLQFSSPRETLSPRTYLSQCNEWDSCGNEEGGLAHPFLLGFQDILLLPRGWDAEMTNSLTTTTSRETITLSFPIF